MSCRGRSGGELGRKERTKRHVSKQTASRLGNCCRCGAISMLCKDGAVGVQGQDNGKRVEVGDGVCKACRS